LLLFLGVLEQPLIQNILGGELDDKFNRLPNPGWNVYPRMNILRGDTSPTGALRCSPLLRYTDFPLNASLLPLY